ncbi:LamG-like jellyroll fold domain-containing protein [Winogradskyella sp. R77965]|uniref:HYR-like domain-containing protein n=1 Tax=Winogradskyella sp. R77965 TaxID=3093872 RepID=UPI0037DCDA71
MKKLYTYLIVFVVLFGIHKTSAQFEIFESYVNLNSGSENNSYDLFSPSNTIKENTPLEKDAENTETSGFEFFAVTCPSNISVNVDLGVCNAIVIFAPPPSTDIFGGSMVLTSALGDGDTFPVGTTTVTYEERDAGNVATGLTCSFDVTVTDNENPVIAAAPANITVECITDVPAMIDLAWTDNCDAGGNVTGSDSALTGGACGGTITRTWNIADANGNNAATQTQIITIDDTIDPVIAASPANITVDCISDVPAMIDLAWTDNCDAGGNVTGSDSALVGNTYNGTITRTWDIADACGNNAITQTQIITINDTVDPVIAAAPANITVECITDVPAMIDLAWTDNCDAGGNVTGSDSALAGGACGGTITRTWNIADANGNNAATQTQIITIDDTIDPVIAAAPANITVDCISDVPAMIDLSWTDNCDAGGNVTGVDAALVGNTYNGTITRTWNITDACGNNAITQTQIITINDAINPVIAAAPANITVECITDVPAMIDLAWTDNCDAGGNVTGSDSALAGGACGGTITRTWNIADANGNNAATQTQIITIDDTIDPVIAAAPANITVDCISDVPAMIDLSWTDNCDAGGNVTGVDAALVGNTYNGTITRTWNITDACGNNAITQTQIITINDTVDPVIAAAPANITVECITDVPAMIDLAWTDNCDAGGNVTGSDSALAGGACGGTITRTWNIADANGNNAATQTQIITIDDTIDPVIAASPANITVDCISDVPAMIDLAWTDNCDAGGNVTGSDSALVGNTYNGTITRTWDIADACGNNAITQTQIITINDTVDPVIAAAPANITVECITDVPAMIDLAWTDNCDAGGNVTGSDSALAGGACGGTITRTWNIADANGNNAATQTQIITIDDTIDPVIAAAPANITVDCISDVPAMIDLSWTDNCDAGGNVTGVDAALVGNTYNGTITRTWNITDACGNNAITQTQIITINDTVDPVIAAAPANITVECITDVPAMIDLAWTDNCDAGGNVTGSDSALAGGACGGTITRTWNIADANGNNAATQTQIITIDDTIDPVIAAAPANITVDCISDVPAMIDLSWTDNCDAGGNVTGVDAALVGNTYNGTITRTWNITDACGNNAITQTQIITINDAINPVIAAAPANITVECITDVPAMIDLAWTDNCDAGGNVTGSDSALAGGACGGTITRTWNIADANGNNASTQTQIITIDDTIDPVIAAAPANITVDCISDVPAMIDLSWTDNCDAGGNVTGVDAALVGNTYNGTITRTWNITDACGNNATTRTQIITINENTAPVITCPANLTIECDASILPANTGTATAIDNCAAVADITITYSDAVASGTGNNSVITRTWTATDENSNSSSCDQIINVTDSTPPTAVCQVITVELDPNGTINISPIDIDNGSSDNCGIQSISVSPMTFTCADVGTNTVTLTVTDVNGNMATCTSTVIVEDVTPPTTNVAECGSLEITIDPVSGQAVISQAQVDALYTGSDSCGLQSITLAQTTFGCNEIGVNTVQLTILDNNGNSSICSATITVNAPIITSGTLTGLVVDPIPDTVVPADDLIEVTACPGGIAVPKDVQLTLNLDASSTVNAANISTWQISNDNGATWTDVAGTAGLTQYTLPDLLTTTLVRVEIQSGNCLEYSPLAIVRFLPPDEPPIITSISNTDICLNDAVTIVAESFFEYGGQFGGGGDFNEANPEGWAVDGIEDDLNASGNNTNTNRWKETNGPTVFGNLRYDTSDNTKFAIANGPRLTTLETPIFNTIGMTASEAVLEFYQAYYFCTGAEGKIELSLDGGATYTIVLTTVQNDNYIGPNDSGFAWNGNNCGNGPNGRRVTSEPLQFASIDLSAYLGMANLRIQFTFDALGVSSCTDNFPVDPGYGCTVGNTNETVVSSWVIDDVGFPYTAIDEELEWTDEDGGVVATGSTVNVTPITPGIQEYGVTSLVNGCRANTDDGTEFVTINTSLAYAGQDFAPIASDCGQSTINLKAYDNTITAVQNFDLNAWEAGLYTVPDIVAGDTDYPGTGEVGSWSIIGTSGGGCGTSATFSSNANPRATFTADPGTYTLRWTLANGCFDDVVININSCNDIDFDGTNDFVNLKDNYAVNSSFSIENWVKPNSVSGNHTILSKKNASDNTRGYVLNIENGIVKFNWFNTLGNGTIASQFAIDTSRWYHIAVTFDGTAYLLYIDGIDVGTVSGTTNPPETTTSIAEALVGALDNDIESNNNVINLYHGWMDELRIWNTTLTAAQIRQMMNQEIQDNTAVRGVSVPLDVAGLNWTDLDGYYKMNVNCGYLSADKGTTGRLRNMSSSQQNTAPLPYTSRVDGQNWATDNTWTNFNVWDAPNSLGVDGTTSIDWNIVQTSHDIDSGDRDITVLGLISDTPNKVLNISDPVTAQDETNDGQMLRVTHYLDLDGDIDLVGESQLLQDLGSVLDATSNGKIKRDQQGTTNLYNYNYWSSPVNNSSTTFTVASSMFDGTIASNPQSLQWTNSYDANPATTPITLSRRWLYLYRNNLENTYADWEPIDENTAVQLGYGYLMKGSGTGGAYQNYGFSGLPNNGLITNTITGGYQSLVGNPYPSALIASTFITDNIAVLKDGSISFWEHAPSNSTHILEDYEGGYSIRNLTGGLAAVSPPEINGLGTATKIPGPYVPVAQGFFVTSNATGGLITFDNNQRIFAKEDGSNSLFFRGVNSNTAKSITDGDVDNDQFIRIDFITPENAVRHLLLGFMNNENATDGIDYGYDALNTENLPSDMSFNIEGERFVIQGVGSFDETKVYPLDIILSNGGTIQIALNALENFDEAIDVYIFDALLNTYSHINDTNFELTLGSGEFIDRFYMAFIDNSSLSYNDFEDEGFDISYLNESKEILINSSNIYNVKAVELFNMNGQKVTEYNNEDFTYRSNELSITIPAPDISEGVYIVKCYSSDHFYNKKVVIRR